MLLSLSFSHIRFFRVISFLLKAAEKQEPRVLGISSELFKYASDHASAIIREIFNEIINFALLHIRKTLKGGVFCDR